MKLITKNGKGGFVNSPPKNGVWRQKLYNHQIAIVVNFPKWCLTFCIFKTMGDMRIQKPFLKILIITEIGDFRPVLPPKSAINGCEIITRGNYLE